MWTERTSKPTFLIYNSELKINLNSQWQKTRNKIEVKKKKIDIVLLSGLSFHLTVLPCLEK